MVTRQALLSVFGLTLFLLTRTNSLQWGTKQAISNSWPLNTTKPAAVVEDCYEASNARGDAATAATTIRAGGLDGRDRRNRAAFPEETSWIQEFCRTPGNEFFAEVPESFIRENMNLIDIGRGVEIPYFKEALGVLLGERRINVRVHGDAGRKASIVQSSAALLYGLIHARFVVSHQGLNVVLKKFSKAGYGRCPRVYCQGQAVLPVGETDRPLQNSVKVFCPRCGDLFFPSPHVRACDGAFWGTTLPHLLLLGWPELRTTPSPSKYVPRAYGFKVHSGNADPGVESVHDGATRRHADQQGLL
eukprot:jgi/Undpi1/3100/HiC_scaffold_15.g06474.m1